MNASSSPSSRPWLRYLALAYLLVLAASHLYRWWTPPPLRPASPDSLSLRLPPQEGSSSPVTISYFDRGPLERTSSTVSPQDTPPVVILVHGSPGAKGNFRRVIPALARDLRVLAPDLPGYGASTRSIPDYSIEAHARHLLRWTDALGIDKAHWVGYSMGGGVVLEVQRLDPDRVESLVLLSAIGVQEMELLGNYHFNHLVHGIQLAILWGLREGFPHFGALDDAFLSVEYARNFYDTDQRPLRTILRQYRKPMLIIHAEGDPLVPVEAAREHHRLVPQSILLMREDSHFGVFVDGPGVARQIESFVKQVEAGEAPTRSQADPQRIAEALKPFDPGSVPAAKGLTLVVFWLLIVTATFISEDLTCILAGLIIAAGRIDFLTGASACFAGIVLGDIGLFWMGRLLGRPALKRAPLKWLLSDDDIDRSSRWLAVNGPAVIAASRFLPGSRLPTYFAAGMLNTSFAVFLFYFILMALIWTPALVGLALYLGQDAMRYLDYFQEYAWLALVALVAAIYFSTRVLLPLTNFRGRRLLAGRIRRKLNWEFWPPWFFYPPVVAAVAAMMVRYRSMTLFTAANPALPQGGFTEEPKSPLLRKVPPSYSLPVRLLSEQPAQALEEVDEFMRQEGLHFPLVIKPERGERGFQVSVAENREEAQQALERGKRRMMAQAFAEGLEFGVFYIRRPGRKQGLITSLTRKILPSVRGDGRHTLEELVLQDRRAVCMASHYFENLKGRLWEVPEEGQEVPLTHVGTHSRGAVFEDGRDLISEDLRLALDEISQALEGFYYGRLDVRAESEEALRRGRFQVLEINGVTSEPTHIYAGSLWQAYRELIRHWNWAFQIGAENRSRGEAQPAALGEMIRLILRRLRR
ncbi:MAG TPA: alpha/beta fold hydrolase [Acidobacteriota bacterium]|nr:alpha/beta fold hydrolase [Acidobacteriota bacterium]